MNPRRAADNRRWVFGTGCLLVVLLIATMAFSLIVDPYDICRLVVIPGVNENKPVAPKHTRMTKPVLQRRYRFQSLVLGSSRAQIGIDPDHPGWAPGLRPAFNYGLGGAGIEEIVQRLEQILQEQTVGQVVLGLDFFMFNALIDNPLAAEPKGERLRLLGGDLQQWLKALGSTDAFTASLETVRKQDRVRHPGCLPNGQIDKSFNIDRVSRFGHRPGFLRVERQYFGDYFPPPRYAYLFRHPETGAETFASFRRLLDLARSNRIDLRLYISPCHARMLEVIVQSGLWPQYEEWKRELVTIVAAEAASRPGREPFPLWDFSGYNSITEEMVPPEGDRQTAMKYFWETSHFKSETGDLVLDRLFGWSEPGREPPADFGTLLSPANIETHLAEARRRQQDYRAIHPQDVAEIAAIANTIPHLHR